MHLRIQQGIQTMNAEYPLSGLMNPPENDALEQLKKEIYRDDKPYRTVQTRIGDLTPEDRKQLVQVARIVLAFQRENVRGTGVSDIDYMGLIERLYRGLKPDLKVLLADVLQEIEPVKVVAKEKAKPTGMSLYENEKYFPKRDQLGTSAQDYYDKFSGAA